MTTQPPLYTSTPTLPVDPQPQTETPPLEKFRELDARIVGSMLAVFLRRYGPEATRELARGIARKYG